MLFIQHVFEPVFTAENKFNEKNAKKRQVNTPSRDTQYLGGIQYIILTIYDHNTTASDGRHLID